MTWTKIENEIPEEHLPVIIASPDDSYGNRWYAIGWREGNIFTNYTDSEIHIDKVEYWKELEEIASENLIQ